MKTKLLRKLRRIGRDQVTILSITKTNGIVTGMKYSFNEDWYRGIFSFGDTEEEVKQKALVIYMSENIDRIRSDYRKYTRKYKYHK